MALGSVASLLGVTLLVALPSPVLAAGSLISPISDIEGVQGACPIYANGNGAQGEPTSETAAVVSGSGFIDDGTVTQWYFYGSQAGNSSIFLDIFAPGFSPSHDVIESQHEDPFNKEDPFGPDEERVVTESIPVVAGQGIGFTVSASADGPKEANAADVYCNNNGSSGSVLAIWDAPLTIGQDLAPSKEGGGELLGGALHITYDKPEIQSVTPETGPATGGTEVTIKGKHLAHASVFFPEGARIVPAASIEAEDSEIKVITPEAVTGDPGELTLETRATGFSVKHKFTYEGTPRSRTPEITLGAVSEITETTAKLNATVNIEGLVTGESGAFCDFGYGAHEIEEETVGCEPLPQPFSETPENVSAQLYELTPGTTYHYFLDVGTKYGYRSGHNMTNDEASFKTLGAGQAGQEKTEREAKEKAEREAKEKAAKELSAVLPAPTGPTLPKGLAPSPIVGLLGGSSLTPTAAGALPVKVSCPVGESTCIGSIIVKTAGAVTADLAGAAKKSVLTLATGSFKVAGGKTATVTLHLSAKARALLKRTHTLAARVTITAHDSAGATHTTVKTITLHAAKRKH